MVSMKVFGIITLLILTAITFSCTSEEVENEEMHPQDTRTSVAGAPESNYFLQLFEEEPGWGFLIYRDSAVFIRQPHIPAIEGNVPFSTRNDAEKTGFLMIRKLENGVMPPSVSIEELDSLGVQY